MYVELQSRSAFSFLEGSSVPEDLITRCAELQMPAMALLDRDGVYGTPRFHMAAAKAGIRAHIGAEVTCEFLDTFARARRPVPPSNLDFGGAGVPARTTHSRKSRLPLLISSRTGYQNLCRLITKMKLSSPKDEGAVSEDE